MQHIVIALKALGISTRRRRTADDTGATAVEYAIMASLIAVVIAATVALLAPELNAIFAAVTGAL